MKSSTHDSHILRKKRGAGVAMVEFALCLPVLMLIVFGALYLGLVLQKLSKLEEIAFQLSYYGSGLPMVIPVRANNPSLAAIENRGNLLMALHGFSSGQVTVRPQQLVQFNRGPYLNTIDGLKVIRIDMSTALPLFASSGSFIKIFNTQSVAWHILGELDIPRSLDLGPSTGVGTANPYE